MPEYSINYGGKTYSINPETPLPPEAVQAAFAQIIDNAKAEQQGQSALLSPDTPVDQKRSFFQSVMFPGKTAVGKEIAKGILPTLGGIGGGALGGVVTSPTIAGVPAGVLAGEMAGAGLGEKANQMIGLTEPSNTAIMTSAAAAPIGRAVMGAGRWGLTQVIKGFGGRELVSDAAEGLLRKWMSPKVPAKELYDQAEQQALNVYAPVFKTQQALNDIIAAEKGRAPTSVNKEILSTLDPLNKFFAPGQGAGSGTRAIPAADIIEEAQRLRSMASSAYDSGNTKLYQKINQVRAAMLDDLDASGVGVVKEANAAYRKEMALDELMRVVRKPKPFKEFKDLMDDNPLVAGAFSGGERDQITSLLKKIAWVAPTGGSGVIGKTITTGVGGYLGGGTGAVAGYLTPDLIKTVISTPFGRNFTRKLLQGKDFMDEPMGAALAVFARGLMAQSPQDNQPEQPTVQAQAAAEAQQTAEVQRSNRDRMLELKKEMTSYGSASPLQQKKMDEVDKKTYDQQRQLLRPR